MKGMILPLLILCYCCFLIGKITGKGQAKASHEELIKLVKEEAYLKGMVDSKKGIIDTAYTKNLR